MLTQIEKKARQGLATVNIFLEKTSAVLNILCALLVVFVCIFTVLFFIAYMQLSYKATEKLMCFQILNFFGLLPKNDGVTSKFILEKSTEIKGVMEFFLNGAVALCGILLSFFTIYSYFRRVVAVKRTSCFKKIQVFESGKEDIDTMLLYFKGADLITVYSRTFSWATKDKMESILETNADTNKLCLYSSDIEIAEIMLKDCPTLKKRLYKTPVDLHFSYVERDNAKYLLYRQEEDTSTYVIVVHENAESKYLLETISRLVKANNPEVR